MLLNCIICVRMGCFYVINQKKVKNCTLKCYLLHLTQKAQYVEAVSCFAPIISLFNVELEITHDFHPLFPWLTYVLLWRNVVPLLNSVVSFDQQLHIIHSIVGAFWVLFSADRDFCLFFHIYMLSSGNFSPLLSLQISSVFLEKKKKKKLT